MRRSSVLKLQETIWFKPLEEHPDLAIGICPTAASEVSSLLFSSDKKLLERICTTLFKDFRGYLEDDGRVIPNTLTARMELYTVIPIRRAINEKATELHEEAVKGEAVAASV